MTILLNLMSGIALLSWGIYITKSGVLRTYGAFLNFYISKSLSSKFWYIKAILAGVFTTAVVQSSNATAMLVSSFLAKGIIELTPALTIMLGADLGTAIMARILTFNLSEVSPIFIVVGVFLFLYRRKNKAGKVGRILIGLGIILMALKIIVNSTAPIVQSSTMQIILNSLNNEYTLALIFGSLLAIICYSSLAAVLLTALISLSGGISLQTALCIVIGANLGSCILEILGATGQGIQAKRVMFGNTLFKLTITILILPFLNLICSYQTNIAINDFIIWFHVIFNTLVCFLLLAFVPLYSKILILCLPDDNNNTNNETQTIYLDTSNLDNSSLALSNAVRETLRLGGYLHEMLLLLKDGVTGKSNIKEQINSKFIIINQLASKIRIYLDDIEFDKSDDTSTRWHQVFSAVISAIHAADIICRMQNEINALNNNPIKNISAKSRSNLVNLINIVNTNLNFVLDILKKKKKYDYDNEQLRCKKDEFKALTDKCSVSELDNLSIDSYYNNSDVGALCIILISDLRQLNGVIFSIACSRFAVLQSKKYQDDLVKTIIKDDE